MVAANHDLQRALSIEYGGAGWRKGRRTRRPLRHGTLRGGDSFFYFLGTATVIHTSALAGEPPFASVELTGTSALSHLTQYRGRREYSKDRWHSYPGKPPGQREDRRNIRCPRKDYGPIPRAEWRQQLLLCQRRQHRRRCRQHLRHIRTPPAGLVDAQLQRRLRASVAGQPSPRRFRPRAIRRVAQTS